MALSYMIFGSYKSMGVYKAFLMVKQKMYSKMLYHVMFSSYITLKTCIMKLIFKEEICIVTHKFQNK